MPRKLAIILGMVLLIGGAAILWRNQATPLNVEPEDSVAATSFQDSNPIVVEEPEKLEISDIEAPGSVNEQKPSPQVGAAKGVDYAKLRPSIREVLAGDNDKERLRIVINGMPETLDGREYRGLKDYLLNPQDGKDGDFRQYEYAVRNYIMDAMRGEKARLGETIGTFSAIYRNEAQGEVMRNYALQHLASTYIDNVSGLSANEKSRIVKTLKSALDDGLSLSGTALVGLQDISRWDPKTVSPSSVGNIAMDMLRDENGDDLSKISAFQVGGELKLKSAGSYARETAFDVNADWVLRMSAVYALGQLGETAGMDALLNDSNKHVRNAALAALNVKRF